MFDENRVELEAALGGAILETPGHTAGSISLFLDDGTFFYGDAAMNGLPSLHRITIWAEDKQRFSRSWQTIIAARPQTIYPGHGRPFGWRELEGNLDKVRTMKLHPWEELGSDKVAAELWELVCRLVERCDAELDCQYIPMAGEYPYLLRAEYPLTETEQGWEIVAGMGFDGLPERIEHRDDLAFPFAWKYRFESGP